MKFRYTAPEPCRIGGVLVQMGDIWEWPEAPDRWWVPVDPPPPPEPVKVAPKKQPEKEQ